MVEIPTPVLDNWNEFLQINPVAQSYILQCNPKEIEFFQMIFLAGHSFGLRHAKKMLERGLRKEEQ